MDKKNNIVDAPDRKGLTIANCVQKPGGQTPCAQSGVCKAAVPGA
jgi:hypothetical protein